MKKKYFDIIGKPIQKGFYVSSNNGIIFFIKQTPTKEWMGEDFYSYFSKEMADSELFDFKESCRDKKLFRTYTSEETSKMMRVKPNDLIRSLKQDAYKAEDCISWVKEKVKQLEQLTQSETPSKKSQLTSKT